REQYDNGADPVVVLTDLLELTHWLTRLKLVPDAGQDATVAELERVRGAAIAGKLGMPVLTRAWQMLLKGVGEARAAPAPLAGAGDIRATIAARRGPAAGLRRRGGAVRRPSRGDAAHPALRPCPIGALRDRPHRRGARRQPAEGPAAPGRPVPVGVDRSRLDG